jgi:hypothetical protein
MMAMTIRRRVPMPAVSRSAQFCSKSGRSRWGRQYFDRPVALSASHPALRGKADPEASLIIRARRERCGVNRPPAAEPQEAGTGAVLSQLPPQSGVGFYVGSGAANASCSMISSRRIPDKICLIRAIRGTRPVWFGLPIFRAGVLDSGAVPKDLHSVPFHLNVCRDVAASRGYAGMSKIVADDRHIGA